jgi:hypothetical protein
MDPRRPSSDPRRRRSLIAGLASTLLLLSGAATFVDPDIWHSMALARETLTLGRVPLIDSFAYTPTLVPVVHHEWGSGIVLYFLAITGGILALQVARAILIAALAVGAVRVALTRGATPGVLTALAPLAIVMSWIGLTALRPQLITLVFLCGWLQMIERDRRGDRSWIPVALIAHVVWLNLHGGFVVGVAFLLLHGLEQAVRRRPFVHVLAVVVVMLVLVAINPYGLAYYRYLVDALTMSRPNIGEWQPIWQAHPFGRMVYFVSLVTAVAAVRANGLARSAGWPILAAAAYLAASHERHVSIYALVWVAYVPGLVAATGAGRSLERLWERPPGPVTHAMGVVLLGVPLALFLSQRPWRLTVPGTTPDGAPAPYPVGAVEYLARNHVRANALVPFGVGAFVSWKLHPLIKVSLDTRYEAAFRPELLVQHIDFFDARDGWQRLLERYPTDLVLARATVPVVHALATQTAWTIVYRDDAYVLFARPGLALPFVDERDRQIVGTFP